ncbi:hypothetical protein PH210_22550 [Paenibacillus sp. BSR1-1]|uniref:hypothetical protein n=1 Tax=Paenibacillus sp. BSR1-1 TaxID=3020845 RepID=UPI0025B1DAC8|nr:hypothetical protein [Paenibacillus sp. BSR1-1]MDN3018956.1 hypothetical protein [Paenibacillus sp. BSR1-1]
MEKGIYIRSREYMENTYKFKKVGVKELMLEFLLVALILSFFGFHKVFIVGIKELLNKEVTKTSYYLIFALIGVLYDFIKLFK